MERKETEWNGMERNGHARSVQAWEGGQGQGACVTAELVAGPFRFKPLAEQNVESGTEDNGTETERVLKCARFGVKDEEGQDRKVLLLW